MPDCQRCPADRHEPAPHLLLTDHGTVALCTSCCARLVLSTHRHGSRVTLSICAADQVAPTTLTETVTV